MYYINLFHINRVRCRKCGQLIGLTTKGKYGKLRKEVVFEIARKIQGYDPPISQ